MSKKSIDEVIGIASPLEIRHVQRIASVDPYRVRVLFRPDLLPPMTYDADHTGPAGWTRTLEQQMEWEELLSQVTILWDFPRSLDRPIIDVCPRLKWVQTTFAGAGQMAKALGVHETDVIVTTPSGIHAGPLAEFVFASLLFHTKRISQLQQWQQDRHWERYGFRELRGQLLTVVGPGRIGREVARLGRAFGMRVTAVGTTDDRGRADELGVDAYAGPEGLIESLSRADCVVLSCPHTDATEGLIGPEEIAAMKSGVVLVNIARGVVVDENAMIEALDSGHIGFAALDVFQNEPLPSSSPLWDMPNVLISPHSASTVYAENERIADIFIDNLELFLKGRPEDMAPLLDVSRGY